MLDVEGGSMSCFVLAEYSFPKHYVAFREKGRFIEKFYNVRHRVGEALECRTFRGIFVHKKDEPLERTHHCIT